MTTLQHIHPQHLATDSLITLAMVQENVRNALLEDLGLVSSKAPIVDLIHRDITAQLIPSSKADCAQVICRDQATISGAAWVNEAFLACDPDLSIEWFVNDGDTVAANTVLFSVTGNAQAILTAERVALNFLQTMSATASETNKYVRLLEGSSTCLLDTRKTLPSMRYAQKYAVQCGGGTNHRIGLADAFLIKENHIMACGGIAAAISTAKRIAPDKLVEVEVENMGELELAVSAGADIIMLDNFTTKQVLEAVEFTCKRAKLEVSGNITDTRITELKTTGVDFISTGAITKNIHAIDLSLRINK